MRSIGEVLGCPDVEANEGRREMRQIEGRIEFENVTYTYPGTGVPAVDDFSLLIEPGECVAFVVKPSGGKSTLMQLAIGLLRPQTGRILLDGVPMAEIDMRTWRLHIAVNDDFDFFGSCAVHVEFGSINRLGS